MFTVFIRNLHFAPIVLESFVKVGTLLWHSTVGPSFFWAVDSASCTSNAWSTLSSACFSNFERLTTTILVSLLLPSFIDPPPFHKFSRHHLFRTENFGELSKKVFVWWILSTSFTATNGANDKKLLFLIRHLHHTTLNHLVLHQLHARSNLTMLQTSPALNLATARCQIFSERAVKILRHSHNNQVKVSWFHIFFDCSSSFGLAESPTWRWDCSHDAPQTLPQLISRNTQDLMLGPHPETSVCLITPSPTVSRSTCGGMVISWMAILMCLRVPFLRVWLKSWDKKNVLTNCPRRPSSGGRPHLSRTQLGYFPSNFSQVRTPRTLCPGSPISALPCASCQLHFPWVHAPTRLPHRPFGRPTRHQLPAGLNPTPCGRSKFFRFLSDVVKYFENIEHFTLAREGGHVEDALFSKTLILPMLCWYKNTSASFGPSLEPDHTLGYFLSFHKSKHSTYTEYSNYSKKSKYSKIL